MRNVKPILCEILALALMLCGCANETPEAVPAPAPVSSSSVDEASGLERLKAEKERAEAEAKAKKEAEAEEKASAESLEWKQAYYDYVKEYIMNAKRYDASFGIGDSSINVVSLVDLYGDDVPVLFLWCTHMESWSHGESPMVIGRHFSNGHLVNVITPDNTSNLGENSSDGSIKKMETLYFNSDANQLTVSYEYYGSIYVDAYENGKWENVYTLASAYQSPGPDWFIEFGDRTDFWPSEPDEIYDKQYPGIPVMDRSVFEDTINDYLADFEKVDFEKYKITFPEVKTAGLVDWVEAAAAIADLFNSYDGRDNFEAKNAYEEASEIIDRTQESADNWNASEGDTVNVGTETPSPSAETISWAKVYSDFLLTLESGTAENEGSGGQMTYLGHFENVNPTVFYEIEFRSFSGYDYPVLVSRTGSLYGTPSSLTAYPIKDGKITSVPASDKDNSFFYGSPDYEYAQNEKKGRMELKFNGYNDSGAKLKSDYQNALDWLSKQK